MAPDTGGWSSTRAQGPMSYERKIAEEMNQSIDWAELQDTVQQLTGCDTQLTEEWSVGRHAYVRGLILNPGGFWICKFLQDRSDESNDNLKKEDLIIRMLQKITSLPIPQSHGIVTLNNKGASRKCLLTDLAEGLSGEKFFTNTTEDKWDFYFYQQRDTLKATARVTLQLAQYQSSCGGPLAIADEHQQRLVVGGCGDHPRYSTPMEFYCDHAEIIGAQIEESMQKKEPGDWEICITALNIFFRIIPFFINDDSRFYLGHPDLGGHNMIFSRDGSLQGLLDCGDVGFFPLHYVLQPPTRVGLDVLSKQTVSPRHREESPGARSMSEYALTMRTVAREEKKKKFGCKLAANLLSPGVTAVRILQEVRTGRRDICEAWISSPDIQALLVLAQSVPRLPAFLANQLPNVLQTNEILAELEKSRKISTDALCEKLRQASDSFNQLDGWTFISKKRCERHLNTILCTMTMTREQRLICAIWWDSLTQRNTFLKHEFYAAPKLVVSSDFR